MKKTHLHAWCVILVGVVLCLTLLLTAQTLLIPRGASANAEMQLMRDYMHAEDTAHDEVIFLGDCEVYESFSPVTLWQEHGIESRVIGTPQQLLWHSYAALAEALERSSPRLVVLSVYALVYDEPQSEAYNRMALEALPHSRAKWEVMRASLTEDESALSYLLPILRYHDRWSELAWSDVTALLTPYAPVSSRGYLVQTGVVSAASPLPNHEGALLPPDPAFGETALGWFDRIATLCESHGVSLILVKAPTDSWRYPWLEAYEAQTVALAEQYGIPYYNLLTDFERIGLDMTTDSYDGGLHLNVAGAEKLSRYFGRILTEKYTLTDTREDAARVVVWQSEIERYERMKEGTR